MFSIGCFNKETIERKIPLSSVFNLPNFGEIFIFNDLRPIFSRLIFQPVNVFIQSKIGLSFIFNDLLPIFSRLIFQSANVFTDVKIDVSFIFNDLRPIYIRNKVVIFNELKIELVNYDLTLTI